MTLHTHPDDITKRVATPAPVQVHPRVGFHFDGELDDVPTDAAAALAGVTRALLKDDDKHDGRSSTMRMVRLSSLLNLSLTDPQCSPACLGGSGDLWDTAGREGLPPAELRLALDSSADGGLRLHRALVLAEEPMTASSIPSQRWGGQRRNPSRTHRRSDQSSRKKASRMSLIKREHRTAGWPLETMWSQDLVDTAFGDMFRNFFSGEGILGRVQGTHAMRLEEFLEGDTCVIRAELPGIDPEKDVDISVADGILYLRAEREERSEEKRPDGYRSEFHYGRLARSIRLPEGATEADVTASYKDGILEVRVPAPKALAAPTSSKIPIARD